MNLILLEEADFEDEKRVRLRDRRLEHVRDVHRARPGDLLRVGLLGGRIGTARVLAIGRATVSEESRVEALSKAATRQDR